MAYQVNVNAQVSILHEVQNVAGTGRSTGKAGTITTALFDQAGVVSANAVTITEVGTTGFYTIKTTPDVVGNWFMVVTNPAGTDEQITNYAVVVLADGAIVPAASTDLTTLARVKERMKDLAGTEFDAIINTLISEVSDDIMNKANRIFNEQTYTEYYNGSGTSRLLLRQGPLVSVTSVEQVEYGGTVSRTETLTVVNEGVRLEYGLRSERRLTFGWIELIHDLFLVGQRNYKVVYTAGFVTLPDALVMAATRRVMELFITREAVGLDARSVGDVEINPVSLIASDRAYERSIAPFVLPGIA